MLRLRFVLAFMLVVLAISILELNLWVIMILVWFGIGIFIIKKGLYKNLNPTELKFWIIVLYCYPLVETIIKVFLYYDIIPYSYEPLNIVEHSFWAFSMTFYLLPFFKAKNLNKLWVLIALWGVVIIIGNINEFVELIIRVTLFRKVTAEYWSLAYFDTMRDLLMNIAGSSLGIVILKILKHEKIENSKVLSF